jgi:hypothetical protein
MYTANNGASAAGGPSIQQLQQDRRLSNLTLPAEYKEIIHLSQNIPAFDLILDSSAWVKMITFFNEADMFACSHRTTTAFVQNNISPQVANKIRAFKSIDAQTFQRYSTTQLRGICLSMAAPLTAESFLSDLRATAAYQAGLKLGVSTYHINSRNFHSIMDRATLTIGSLRSAYSEIIIYADPAALKVRYKKDRDIPDMSLVELTESLLQDHILTLLATWDLNKSLKKPSTFLEYLSSLELILSEIRTVFGIPQLTLWQCLTDFNKEKASHKKEAISHLSTPIDKVLPSITEADSPTFIEVSDTTVLETSLNNDDGDIYQVSFNEKFPKHTTYTPSQVLQRAPVDKPTDKAKIPCYRYFFHDCPKSAADCQFDHSPTAMAELTKKASRDK